MALRQRQWARRTVQQLRDYFGNKCAQCGETKNLELDCIQPCGHWHHQIEWSWRASFYRAQFREGNLQLLCRACNSIKENQTKQLELVSEEPF